MPAIPSATWVATLRAALDAELGLYLKVHNPDTALHHLKQARATDPTFRSLTLCRTSDPAVIMIVKPGVTLPKDE